MKRKQFLPGIAVILFFLIFFACDGVLEPIGRWNPTDPAYEAETDPNNVETAVPVLPVNLEAAVVTHESVKLEWINKALYAEGFNIYKKVGETGEWKLLAAITDLNDLSYIDTDISPGTQYYYRISAYNENGESLFSTEINVTTTSQIPVAAFTSDKTGGTSPLLVQFTDQSTGDITTWEWNFDNNSAVDSYEQNPSYTYTTSGLYTVRLRVSGPGGTDEEVKTQYIAVDVPVANFSADVTEGPEGTTVAFTNLSTGNITTWEWDFTNDSSVDSTEVSPSYQYNTAGIYDVRLKVSGSSGIDETIKTDYIVIGTPVAAFHADVTSGLANPNLHVTFTDDSSGSGITAWAWDIGDDGTIEGTAQSFGYDFSAEGSYTVSLAVTNSYGSDELVKTGYIDVYEPVAAGFTANTTSGESRLSVNFTDQSTGTIDTWEWDFNDDGTTDSTEQSPAWVFGTPGTYSVGLTVSGDGGTDTETKYSYISTDFPAPVAHQANPLGFSGAKGVAAADMDGDGNMDILAAATNYNKVSWFENVNGAGTSWSEHQIGTGSGANDICAADFDQDGDMDAAGVYGSANTIRYYINSNGAGTTWTATTLSFTTFQMGTSVHAADVNGDSYPDIMGTSQTDNKVSLWLNNGNGTFGSEVIIDGSFSYARDVCTGDVNGDTYPDIIACAWGGDIVSWWANNGSGSFGARQGIATGDAPNFVFAGDINGDGDIDVLTAYENDDNFTWCDNNGSGTFTQRLIDSVNDPKGGCAADLDFDGDMDVICSSNDSDYIAWWANEGGLNPSWTRRTFASGSSYDQPWGVAAEDVDGDGTTDAIGGIYFSGKVYWWELLK